MDFFNLCKYLIYILHIKIEYWRPSKVKNVFVLGKRGILFIKGMDYSCNIINDNCSNQMIS